MGVSMSKNCETTCRYEAVRAAFALVMLGNSKARELHGEQAKCANQMGAYESSFGTTYTIHRDRDSGDNNVFYIQYHNRDCVNDGYKTYVYVCEDNIVTWEN